MGKVSISKKSMKKQRCSGKTFEFIDIRKDDLGKSYLTLVNGDGTDLSSVYMDRYYLFKDNLPVLILVSLLNLFEIFDSYGKGKFHAYGNLEKKIQNI